LANLCDVFAGNLLFEHFPPHFSSPKDKQPEDGICRNLKNASQILKEIQEKKYSRLQTMQ